MKRKYVYFLLGNILGINSLYAQYPNNCYSGDLTNYQTSWIANDGGTPYTHVPHSMDAIFDYGKTEKFTVFLMNLELEVGDETPEKLLYLTTNMCTN